MDAELIEAALTSESVTRLVAAADAELREYGISGVPLFIIGSDSGARLAVSGAQGADALLETMQKVQAAA
jgi:predicted DsbA family dithiol-disulfide isomerase